MGLLFKMMGRSLYVLFFAWEGSKEGTCLWCVRDINLHSKAIQNKTADSLGFFAGSMSVF
jgi:hypothetical protein